tara:strand:+ start:442 stop:723 length:282 start_codon:yes stop_codon:yes gene_type:complete
MFKIGEKVVFVGKQREPKFKGFIYPQVNEIVTIHSICNIYNAYDISEYLRDSNGRLQSFKPDNFRKLDHSFAEKLLNKITEEVSKDNLVEAYS